MLNSGGLSCLTMSAYGQFGYSYPSASQLLVTGQGTTGTSPPLVSPGSSSLPPGGVSPSSSNAPPGPGSTANGSSCCDNGRPIMTDPVTGQTVCSCQYDSARLALSSYPRLSSGVGVYGTPYPSTDQNPYPSIGVDSSAFYSPLSNPYGLKESGSSADMSAWTSAGLQTTTGYYPYDPTLAAYGYGTGYDLAARRKNATRESTATLKAWLNEHKKNPYPTKGEKIMLAIITKMTLTQVSTWFANARRRLKKENKMTWEPKNKTDDDEDAVVSDGDDKDKDDLSFDGDKVKDRLRDDKDPLHRVKMESRHYDKDLDDDDDMDDDDRKSAEMMGHHHHIAHHHMHHSMLGALKEEIKSDCGIPIPATKPKIWSLADTAACKTPPPSQQPWLASNSGCSGSSMSLNSFALPSNTMSPSAGSQAPYSRYSGFLGPYNGSSNHSGGFPEVQTDTPPQTPPNMKLPNLVNSNSCPAGQAQPNQHQQPGYHQGAGGFSNSYSRHPSQLSPQKERQDFGPQSLQQQMRISSNPPQQHPHQLNPNEGTAFKPFFKGSPPMNNGFVSPV